MFSSLQLLKRVLIIFYMYQITFDWLLTLLLFSTRVKLPPQRAKNCLRAQVKNGSIIDLDVTCYKVQHRKNNILITNYHSVKWIPNKTTTFLFSQAQNHCMRMCCVSAWCHWLCTPGGTAREPAGSTHGATPGHSAIQNSRAHRTGLCKYFAVLPLIPCKLCTLIELTHRGNLIDVGQNH